MGVCTFGATILQSVRQASWKLYHRVIIVPRMLLRPYMVKKEIEGNFEAKQKVNIHPCCCFCSTEMSPGMVTFLFQKTESFNTCNKYIFV